MRIKVGDFVFVKSWKEMEKAHGLDIVGDIDLHPYSFASSMRKSCSNFFNVDGLSGYNGYYLDSPICKIDFYGTKRPYLYIGKMLQKAKTKRIL